MKALSEAHYARRNSLIEKLETAASAVEAVVEAYNTVLEEAREFAADVRSDIEEYISKRSEKWQESETGQSYASWLSEWENLELDDLDVPDMPHSAVLEGAQEEP